MKAIITFKNITKEDQVKLIESNCGNIIKINSDYEIIVSGDIDFYMKLRDESNIKIVDFAVTKQDKEKIQKYVNETLPPVQLEKMNTNELAKLAFHPLEHFSDKESPEFEKMCKGEQWGYTAPLPIGYKEEPYNSSRIAWLDLPGRCPRPCV